MVVGFLAAGPGIVSVTGSLTIISGCFYTGALMIVAVISWIGLRIALASLIVVILGSFDCSVFIVTGSFTTTTGCFSTTGSLTLFVSFTTNGSDTRTGYLTTIGYLTVTVSLTINGCLTMIGSEITAGSRTTTGYFTSTGCWLVIGVYLVSTGVDLVTDSCTLTSWMMVWTGAWLRTTSK